jgi:hypothetical protein
LLGFSLCIMKQLWKNPEFREKTFNSLCWDFPYASVHTHKCTKFMCVELSIPFVGIFLMHPSYAPLLGGLIRLDFQFPLLGFSLCILYTVIRHWADALIFLFQFPLLGFSLCIRGLFWALLLEGALSSTRWGALFDYLLIVKPFIKIIEGAIYGLVWSSLSGLFILDF